jgi:hypothetical protein
MLSFKKMREMSSRIAFVKKTDFLNFQLITQKGEQGRKWMGSG